MLLQLLDHQERHLILGVDFRWPGDLFGHFAWLRSLGFESRFRPFIPAGKWSFSNPRKAFPGINGVPPPPFVPKCRAVRASETAGDRILEHRCGSSSRSSRSRVRC
jgi:hypothetical protein